MRKLESVFLIIFFFTFSASSSVSDAANQLGGGLICNQCVCKRPPGGGAERLSMGVCGDGGGGGVEAEAGPG